MPKRSRSGVASRPARVVAPTSVNGEQVDAHGARRRPLADDQVELEVLHRRIQHFLDRGLQAVDLVDEQDIPGLEVCQDCGEVAGALDHRPGGGAEPDAQFAGDDLRQRGLAEARGAVQQHVVQRLAAAAGGLDEDGEVLARWPAGRRTRPGSAGAGWPPRRPPRAGPGRPRCPRRSPCGRGRGRGGPVLFPVRLRRPLIRRPLRQFLQAVADHRVERRRVAQPLDRRVPPPAAPPAAGSRD